jgi:hypothetical protein
MMIGGHIEVCQIGGRYTGVVPGLERKGDERMKDRLRGLVTEVVDGRTFIIRVLHQREKNEYGYDEMETVRFETTMDPEIAMSDELARKRLEFELVNQVVDCVVYDCVEDALMVRFAVVGDSIY